MFSFLSSWCAFVFILGMGLRAFALDKYTAAVYEHAIILAENPAKLVSSEEALNLMNKNMDVLEEAIKMAASQGAQIIVTPEDGIYGFGFTRKTLYPYLEDIPDPQVNWIPCIDPERFGTTPVQVRLSCLARQNSIYVVANIGDKKPCNFTDPECPKDGRYQYNTNVVFDSLGKLVARYHKFNLFMIERWQYDFPKEPELVTFSTPFGKFGLFTCFDILFHDPAVTLVSNLHVDTILFPTAWINVLPHLTAIEFHSAWAMGMRVNFLASNIHLRSRNMTGSGIYAPDGPRAFHYDAKSEDGHLLFAKLDSHPSLSTTNISAFNWRLFATAIKPYPEEHNFTGNIFYDEYIFSELSKKAGNLTVCQKNLCCHLSYRMKEQQEDEHYVLGAFDGLHVVEGEYYMQVCTLLMCEGTDLQTCGKSVTTAHTQFDYFSLSGTFNTNYVFPEVLLSGVQLAPGQFQVLSDGQLVSLNGTSQPILTVTLFGRWFEKDPLHLHTNYI